MPEWRASIEVNLYVTANYKAPRDDEQAWVKANGMSIDLIVVIAWAALLVLSAEVCVD